jgi:hypothetical protein
MSHLFPIEGSVGGGKERHAERPVEKDVAAMWWTARSKTSTDVATSATWPSPAEDVENVRLVAGE